MLRKSLFLTATLMASHLSAAEFTVNTDVDSVDETIGDGICANLFGECSLRAAVQEANATPGLDSINIPEGVYGLSLGLTGEDLAAEGDLDITESLNIIGAGGKAEDVTISGNNNYRISIHETDNEILLLVVGPYKPPAGQRLL